MVNRTQQVVFKVKLYHMNLIAMVFRQGTSPGVNLQSSNDCFHRMATASHPVQRVKAMLMMSKIFICDIKE